MKEWTITYNYTDYTDTFIGTKEEAKARADQFIAKATDEASFIAATKEFAPPSLKDAYADDSATLQKNLTKTNLVSLSEEFANWTFDAKRHSGDTAVFDKLILSFSLKSSLNALIKLE